MVWQFEEIGYDFSINCDLEHPNASNESYRCNKKPRPEGRGYFTQAERVEAFTKCAQTITLRTRLLPQVFEGNPTAVNIGSRAKLRTIQWGSDVFVAANFDTTSVQTVNLPSGIWYDYLDGGAQAGSSYNLKAGQLKIFTGQPLTAPTFEDIMKRDPEGIETVTEDKTRVSGEKFIRDGQLYIRRGERTYTITGQEIR
jgi:hypothetical protein